VISAVCCKLHDVVNHAGPLVSKISLFSLGVAMSSELHVRWLTAQNTTEWGLWYV